jgi:signal peptidase II
MWQRLRLLLVVFAIIVPADQLTKVYIDDTMELYQSFTVIENFFNISYVHNTGAAFGLLADHPARVAVLLGIAAVACSIIAALLWRLPQQLVMQRLGLSLVFSGAVGNLIDRIRLGVVIDFIDVHWYQHHWPAFNVADSAITVGVTLLLLDLWRTELRQKRQG